MTRSTPTIHGTTLLFPAEGQATSIVVGSAQWFEWLGKETTTIFSFHARDASSYTARKERAGNRRGAWYWKAYRTYQGKLYRTYLGKSEELTLPRLDEIAQTLSTRVHDQESGKQDVSNVGRQVRLPYQPYHQSCSDTPVVPFLETKLHPPQLPALLVERSRLLTLLDLGQRQKLTLLQA